MVSNVVGLWSRTSLLEEFDNCSAHPPAPRQMRKCWENVLVAPKSHSNTNDNY